MAAVTVARVERRAVEIPNPDAERIGFSRAVRVGPFVSGGGAAPIAGDGTTAGEDDAGAQARRCLEIIGRGLEGAGASLDHVVRTRTLLTRIADYEAVAAVRKESVGHVKPVDTSMRVDRFVDADWVVEIEVDAVMADPTASLRPWLARSDHPVVPWPIGVSARRPKAIPHG